MERLAYFILLIGVASCMQIEFKPCGGDKIPTAKNITMKIEPCTSQPCKLIKGQAFTIAVNFQPTSVVKTLAVEVHAYVHGASIPYPISKPDACTDSGLTCPLAAGAEANYEYSLKVSILYPSISLKLRWDLVDDTGASQVCADFPLVVTSASYLYVP